MAGSPVVTKRKTARDIVADYVRQAILSGELAPGSRLNVQEIANLLEVSHTPTREAFQHLAAEGLLRLHAFRGARVAELSAAECQEIFLMRVGLEGLASQLGAEAIDDEGVETMRECLEAMRIAADRGSIDEFLAADRTFHRAHYLASGRERLWERIISLRYAAERYTRLGYELPDVGMDDVLGSHGEILAAVARHDGDAAQRLVKADLTRTFESVSQKLAEDEALAAS